jgi:hypothetical protein
VTPYCGRWIVFSGARDIAHGAERLVQERTAEIVRALPEGCIFGGARGVDNIALLAAREARTWRTTNPWLLVIVPGTVDEQPREVRASIRAAADEIIEMGLPLRLAKSYHQRNGRMLLEASRRTEHGDPEPMLVAFPGLGQTGGTTNTLSQAMAFGFDVETTTVALENGGAD